MQATWQGRMGCPMPTIPHDGSRTHSCTQLICRTPQDELIPVQELSQIDLQPSSNIFLHSLSSDFHLIVGIISLLIVNPLDEFMKLVSSITRSMAFQMLGYVLLVFFSFPCMLPFLAAYESSFVYAIKLVCSQHPLLTNYLKTLFNFAKEKSKYCNNKENNSMTKNTCSRLQKLLEVHQ